MPKARPDESLSRSSNSPSKSASALTRLLGQRPTHSFIRAPTQDGTDRGLVHCCRLWPDLPIFHWRADDQEMRLVMRTLPIATLFLCSICCLIFLGLATLRG